MKRLGFVLMFLFVFVRAANCQIQNTPHDFSSEHWSGGKVCDVCHVGHSSNDELLWNHETTQANFILYSSSTMDATLNQPNGSSRLCLSCHDGTIAVDSFGGKVGNARISGKALMGLDLRDVHPISFIYDASLSYADKGLRNPTITPSGLGGTIDSDLLDENHQLQCTSCHDIHNQNGSGNLLVTGSSVSGLCLTCHNK
ncbi:MAG: cytochrome c3 family protein [Calditrichaeota bacterium]|nr:cytochrome c3 family protein [Calditrichota bacterium]